MLSLIGILGGLANLWLSQSYKLSETDYRAEIFKKHTCDLKGNNDILSLTQPQIVQQIHEAYLDAGANIIETNTFNANAISQLDYKLENHVYDMNLASAKIAKQSIKKTVVVSVSI